MVMSPSAWMPPQPPVAEAAAAKGFVKMRQAVQVKRQAAKQAAQDGQGAGHGPQDASATEKAARRGGLFYVRLSFPKNLQEVVRRRKLSSKLLLNQ